MRYGIRPWLLLAAAGLAACAHSPPPAAPAAPSSIDVSGEWVSSSGDEPAGSTVTITRPCGKTVTEWRFTHTPPHLSAILVQGAPLQGEAHDLPIAEWMSGTTNGIEFDLRASAQGKLGKPVAVHLRYDAQARRLRGTRGGDSVWFAPLRVEEPRDCRDGIAVPAPFDLSGRWSTGRGVAEPGGTNVTLEPGCTYNPAAWVIQQTRDSVEAWSFSESVNQGTRRVDSPLAKLMPARGRVSGLDVRMQSEQSRY